MKDILQNTAVGKRICYYCRFIVNESILVCTPLYHYQDKIYYQTDNHKFWRSTFTCPISKATVSSSIPLALLRKNKDGDLPEGYAALLAEYKQLFGDYMISNSGDVLIRTKKGARQSAAMAMVLHIGLQKFPQISSGDSSQRKKKAKVCGDSSQEAASDKSSQSTSIPVMGKRSSEIPVWVYLLHQAGIRQISVMYRERRSMKDTEWKVQPIKLCAAITILQPVQRTVSASKCN